MLRFSKGLKMGPLDNFERSPDFVVRKTKIIVFIAKQGDHRHEILFGYIIFLF